MRARVGILGVAVVLIIVIGGFVVTRPSVQATSTVDPDVTIHCEASAASAEACLAWGDDLLGAGPPSTTFEMQDLAQLVIRRPLFGLGAPCAVDYILGRYPDDPAWSEETPCR